MLTEREERRKKTMRVLRHVIVNGLIRTQKCELESENKHISQKREAVSEMV